MIILRHIILFLSDIRDWAAYRLVMALPSHWPLVEPLWFELLPYAGSWGYRTDPWVQECRAHWLRTGRDLHAEGGL